MINVCCWPAVLQAHAEVRIDHGGAALQACQQHKEAQEGGGVPRVGDAVAVEGESFPHSNNPSDANEASCPSAAPCRVAERAPHRARERGWEAATAGSHH